MKRILILWAILSLSGCHLIPTPQKGGGASVGASVSPAPQNPGKGLETASVGIPAENAMPAATITQPENPQGSSGQNVTYDHISEVTTPVDVVKTTTTVYPDGRKVTVEEPQAAGTKVVNHTSQKVEQNLGGTWKDTAREVAVKLSAYSSLIYIGVGLIIFGAAGLFYTPLKVILGGGKQFPIAVAAIGALLVITPMMLVGNEGPVLIGAVVLGGVAWLVIRLTRKEAVSDTIAANPGSVQPPATTPVPPKTP